MAQEHKGMLLCTNRPSCGEYCVNLNQTNVICFRNDEKTAQDYKVTGGSVLHLVLALRGGSSL